MFSWYVQKAISNFEKHEISFEEAATSFDDADGLDWADLKHSQTESRRKRLAESSDEHLLLTVYTIRQGNDGKETIRIISSRSASYRERRAYLELDD